MPGLVFTDSVRQDKVTVKAFEKKDNNDIVVLAYSLSESYVGKIIDGTGLEQPGLVQIFYDATSRFNVTLGKWESIDGIVVYDINVLQRKRSILKVGMIPRQ
jgi:hypothetical protein